MQRKELKEKELVNKEAEVDELKPHLATNQISSTAVQNLCAFKLQT